MPVSGGSVEPSFLTRRTRSVSRSQARVGGGAGREKRRYIRRMAERPRSKLARPSHRVAQEMEVKNEEVPELFRARSVGSDGCVGAGAVRRPPEEPIVV